jgi:hypothetical protein
MGDRWAEAKARDEAEKAERERRRAEMARARDEAAPVRVVKISLAFESVFVLVVQFLIAELILAAVIGGATLAALAFFGVI